MYEFDEESWDERSLGDQTSFDCQHWKSIDGGFLIQRIEPNSDGERTADAANFLQIGTGNWCPAAWATVFPQRSTAEAYALEFGYVIGRNANVIHRRF